MATNTFTQPSQPLLPQGQSFLPPLTNTTMVLTTPNSRVLLFDDKLGFFYPPPASLLPIPTDVRHGMIALSTVAALSLTLGGGLLIFLLYRTIVGRHNPNPLYRNHYVVLILQLLVADTIQSLGFFMSVHWLRLGAIVAPNAACFLQGFLIQLGDVSSAIFVLLIAIFTFATIVYELKMTHWIFLCVVAGGWALAVFLSVLGPGLHGSDAFLTAGAWCWFPNDRESERLGLHYFWIFFAQFVTLALYIYLFAFLYRRMHKIRRTVSGHTNATANVENLISHLCKAAKNMLVYPVIYIITTLPLCVGRMLNTQGVNPPLVVWCVMGSLMTSAGWVDAIVYTLTRGVLVPKNGSHSGDGRRPESAQSLTGFGASTSNEAPELGYGKDTESFTTSRTNSASMRGGGVAGARPETGPGGRRGVMPGMF